MDDVIIGYQPFALLHPAVSDLPKERTISRLDASDTLAYSKMAMTER